MMLVDHLKKRKQKFCGAADNQVWAVKFVMNPRRKRKQNSEIL